jgi:glucosamine--fructose-6-phosphate aminotransferase (isomerizing)
VLAHLVEAAFDGKLEDAVIDALNLVQGTYGIAVISSRDPDKIVCARQGSPLAHRAWPGRVLRRQRRRRDSSAHAPSRLSRRRRDGRTDRKGIRGAGPERPSHLEGVSRIDWSLDEIEKGGFEHFMLKEICEQPQTIENTMRGRLVADEGFSKLGGLNLTKEELLGIDHVVITACGTSWHSGLIGGMYIEELARIRA